MVQFIVKRVLYGLLVLVGIIAIIFALFNVIPVNSARMTLGQRADAASIEKIERQLNLDQPVHKRFVWYLNDISPISFHNADDPESRIYLGDTSKYFKTKTVTSGVREREIIVPAYTKLVTLGSTAIVLKQPYLGRSFQTQRRVGQMIGEKLMNTFMLALCSILLAAFIGIILGVVAALNQFSFWDNAAVVISTLGISVPSYFSGIIFLMIFAYYLGDITNLNLQGSFIDSDDLGNRIIVWKNLVLPVLALGLRPVAIITQLTRSSMLEVLGQDYIRTAKAKGLSYHKVVFKHALRNALNPVVTSISGWFAALLAGAFFIEIIFGYNGIGQMTVKHLLSFDYPVVMGAVLFIAVVFIVVNIFTDILYSILDPRVSVKG